MTSIHETAYPRFKPELTQRELADVYTPSDEELRFARRTGRSAPARLYVMLLLKAVQRLGYFPMLADIPAPIVSFLSKSTHSRSIPARDIALEERSDSVTRSKSVNKRNAVIHWCYRTSLPLLLTYLLRKVAK